MKKVYCNLFAIIGGGILTFAFAPFNYFLLPIISLFILLWIWKDTKPIVAWWRGWMFGLAYFGSGVYWVYISIHNFGNAPIVLAIITEMLLVGFLALFPAFLGWFWQKFFPKDNWAKFYLAFPSGWVLFEWLRGWLFSGFPWLFLGYSQVASPLKGWMPLVGVYGVAFLLCATTGIIFQLFYQRKKVLYWVLSLSILLAIWVGGYSLRTHLWTTQSTAAIKVSLLQGNIPLEQKWDTKQLEPILQIYADLTRHNLDSQIIIWPEAAIPTFPEDIAKFLKKLDQEVSEKHATVIAGAPLYDVLHGVSYNGIIMFGAHKGKYLKRHLVPFGEYLPLQFLLSWTHNYFTIPMSGFVAGPDAQSPLHVGNILVAPFICYEIAYGDLVLNYLPQAQLLLTICDDSWFGESIAADQHLQIAASRSLETGRYQVISTNTGITAVIDNFGKVVEQAPLFRRAVVTAKIIPMHGSTPWVRFGQYFWQAVLLLFILLARVIHIKSKESQVQGCRGNSAEDGS